MTTAEENKRIARQYPEEVATGRNVDLIDELVTDDFVEHGGPFDEDRHGREADKEQIRSILEAFPDFEATSIRTVGEGDYVATHFTYSGTHDGEFMGIPATGTHVEVSGMAIDRIEDGKIVERWGDADMLGVLQQVGAIDLDGE